RKSKTFLVSHTTQDLVSSEWLIRGLYSLPSKPLISHSDETKSCVVCDTKKVLDFRLYSRSSRWKSAFLKSAIVPVKLFFKVPYRFFAKPATSPSGKNAAKSFLASPCISFSTRSRRFVRHL